ncbi:uncharacterized protein LOC143371187 [Andrena cerasifolii]|uniref:uncharacterized protein LOC143371187 n=1 Tax=Andrena cerasifolii TaxID=2819439 RepID=UPI00403843D5
MHVPTNKGTSPYISPLRRIVSPAVTKLRRNINNSFHVLLENSRLPVPVEYFVNPDKYFHLILLHIDVCQFLGASVVIATETTTLMSVQHACGLFDLVRYISIVY